MIVNRVTEPGAYRGDCAALLREVAVTLDGGELMKHQISRFNCTARLNRDQFDPLDVGSEILEPKIL